MAATGSGCSNPPSDLAMPDQQPILVAGKAGQLARCLTQEAGRRGVSLLALGRPVLDLTDTKCLARVVAAHSPRAIVNAAASTAVDKAEAEPALEASIP
jgi:dTDP-4-dehydrorhamnose reductase